jgi:hypothetical protein
MGRLIFLLAILGFGASTRAATETWLHSDDPENSAYFSPKMRFSMLNNHMALWPGARIGWTTGSVVAFGFEGYFLANELYADYPDTARFSMAVGGITLEATPSPERRTHLVFNVLLGMGGSQVGGDPNLDSLTNRGFIIVEPGVGLEFNLTPRIRLSPGVTYLWISGGVEGLDDKWKASEAAFNLTLRFNDA